MADARGSAGEDPSSSLLPPLLRWAGPVLACGYGLGGRLHRAITTPQPSPLPTICIGNITVGGTGKTPATKYFARELSKRGRKVAVLMRGYKGQGRDEAIEVTAALKDLNVPVLLGGDRLASAQKAREQGRDLALLDDGFQHWRLKRDLDIVLIDATNPFGGGHLAPWGRLRESPEALGRAGVVIITRSDMVEADNLSTLEKRISAYAPQAVIARARHRPAGLRSLDFKQTFPLEKLHGMPINMLCGIGHPEGFRRTLAQLGADIKRTVICDDHDNSIDETLESFLQEAGPRPTIVTEKDAVKLEAISKAERVWVLKIEFEMTRGEDKVWEKIMKSLAVQ